MPAAVRKLDDAELQLLPTATAQVDVVLVRLRVGVGELGERARDPEQVLLARRRAEQNSTEQAAVEAGRDAQVAVVTGQGAGAPNESPAAVKRLIRLWAGAPGTVW